MELALGREVPEPTGQHTLSFSLTNRAKRACSVFGYPSVALLNPAGQELPFVYQRSGDQVVTSQPPQRAELQPGDTAYLTINKYRCDLGDQDQAKIVELSLPGNALRLQVVLPPTAMSFAYCGPGDPGSTVSVSPLSATFGDTLAFH